MVIQGSTPVGDAGTGTTRGAVGDPAAEERWIPPRGLARQIWLLAARRRYLVNRRRQLRTAAILVAVAVAFLAVINFTLYLGRQQETAVLIAAAPELEQVLGKYDRNEIVLSLLGSLVVLAGVYIVTIIETHRTAGAEFNLIRQLNRVADGRYRTLLRLRKGDNLLDVQDPFNRMTQALADRAQEDATVLEGLAAQLDEGRSGETAPRVATELRKLALAKRAFLEEA